MNRKKHLRIGDTVALTSGPDAGRQETVTAKQGASVTVSFSALHNRYPVTYQYLTSSVRKVPQKEAEHA